MTRNEIIQNLITILGKEHVIIDSQRLYNYATDPSTGSQAYPLCAVLPGSAHEVSMIMKFCDSIDQKIVLKGGGSSVSGGFLGSDDTIVLSLERLNRVLEVHEIDRMVVAESGVIMQHMQDILKSRGLWFPQNISSASMCCLGGNVAISSGSPKSLKYGSTKNYVLNLEVVLPNGERMWTGKNVRKNASGYNLTQLFIGSEGTLGVITKVVLEVVPIQKEIAIMVPFKSYTNLFQFVKDLFPLGFSPSSLEFLDRHGCMLVSKYLNRPKLLSKDTEGLLWIEFESDSELENLNKAERLDKLLNKYNSEEPLVAQSAKDKRWLWEPRRKIGEAALNHSRFRDYDIVVPRSRIDEMYEAIATDCQSHDLSFLVVGHIGDGNFHINIFKSEGESLEQWHKNLEKYSALLFKKAIALGGEISGEHGIGKYNKSAFSNLSDPTRIGAMQEIKRIFDPKNILNTTSLFLEKDVAISSELYMLNTEKF